MATLNAPISPPKSLKSSGFAGISGVQRPAIYSQNAVNDTVARVVAKLKEELPGKKYEEWRRKYRKDRAGFVKDCFSWPEGQGPAQYQVKILGDIDKNDKMAVRGPRGLGKTTLIAWIVLHFALTHDGDKNRDWKVVTTAGAWRQLEKFLWPEIHKWARRLRWDIIGRDPFNERTELFTMKLQLKTGEAFAVASDNTDLIEGAHADDLLYVYDESKAISEKAFDASSGAMSGVGAATRNRAKALAFSTPGETKGRFYDIHIGKAGLETWKAVHVTKEEAIAAGRVSTEWVEECKGLWGAQSQLYKNQVEGDFAPADENGIIPIEWVEKAIERWKEITDKGGDFGLLTALGLDVADGGKDDTTFAYGHGYKISKLRVLDKLKKSENDGVSRTMETVGVAVQILDRHTTGEASPVCVVDGNGAGAGVASRLKEIEREKKKGWRVESFIAQESVKDDPKDKLRKDGYGEERPADKRSAAWLNARYVLDPDNNLEPCLPDDRRLMAELVLPRRTTLSNGRVKVESKTDIAKRNDDRSTDFADPVVQAWFANIQGRPKRKGRVW